MIGVSHRPPKCDAPPHRRACLEAAMHRDDVREPEQPGCGGAIYRHRELVAMNGINPVFTKEAHQILDTAGVDRPSEAEVLGRNSGLTEQIAEPPDPIRRTDWNHDMAPPPQLFGQAKHHHFRAAWAIGFEHHRDAKFSSHQSAPIHRFVSFQKGLGSFHHRISS
jgi:hypothetical protein